MRISNIRVIEQLQQKYFEKFNNLKRHSPAVTYRDRYCPPKLYDCSNRTAKEWKERGEQWPLLGVYLILGGCVYITLYCACMFAMFKLNLLKTACYRIMFTLGCADIGNLFCNSISIGYMAVTGAVFCTNPFLMYLLGALNIFFWCLASVLYMILAINRVSYMVEIKFLTRIFEAGGGALWLTFALSYAFFGGIVMKPLPFNSKIFAAVFVPLISDDLQAEIKMYENPFHPFNNALTFIVISVTYSIMCIFVLLNRSYMQENSTDKRIFLQVLMISVPAAMTCLLYMILQYITVPTWVIIVGHLSWQHCTGIASVVYLTLNVEIRGFYRCSRQKRVSYMISTKKGERKGEVLNKPGTRSDEIQKCDR